METATGLRQRVTGVVPRVVGYLREVKAELRKITWPTVDELRQSTTVIILFVIAIGILIGIMDWAFSKLLIDFLGRAFA